MNKQRAMLDILTQCIEEKILPGASISFINRNNDNCFYLGQVGVLPPFNVSVNQGLIYDLASLTKVVGTTTRILQLIEEKKLTLGSKVSNIIDNFVFKEISIENLLLHNSGLIGDFIDKKGINKNNILSKINQTELSFNPLTTYSDLGFILLGLVIEQIDNCDLQTSFYENIFKKLSMTSTSYLAQETKENYVPTEIKKDRGIIQGVVNDTKCYLLDGISGHAGLFSSLSDLNKFIRSLLFDEILIKNETKKLMLSFNVNDRRLGWESTYGERTIFHTGFTGTSIGLDFNNEVAYIVLANRNFPERNSSYLPHQRKLAEVFFNKSN
ncbi:MAG: serine hydrolase domain-containing protein [Erysipelotrichaceae bacterium]